MTLEQLKQYAKRTLSLKGIEDTDENLFICINALKEAFNTCYYSVCLDIDGTICQEGENEVSEEIIDALTNLVKAGVNICFITGRGRSVKTILKSIVLTIMERNRDVSFNMFRRWYCVIHNGVSLLSTIGYEINDFLAYSSRLIADEVIEEYDMKINNCIEEVFKANLSMMEIRECDYKIQLENAGTRFVIYNSNINIEEVKTYLELIKMDLKTTLDLNILQSSYKGNTVLEYSVCNKGHAIAELEKFLGIPKSSMLRIGDQGNIGGNDYEMLDCKQGFTVRELSNNPCGCFPFLDLEDYNIEKGPNAAAHLLKYFTVATAICLEKPNIDRYKVNLASVEKMAAIKSKEYLYKYSNITSAWMNSRDLNQPSIYNIFDIQSGAVKFKNFEWELIPSENEFKKLFMKTGNGSYGDKRPNLLYALMTDTSIILRGPNNYYYGLCFRKDKEKEVSPDELIELYINWIEAFRKFLSDASFAIHSINTNSLFQEDYNRKFLFGVMDSIRNILLTLLNALIEKEAEKNIFIWYITEKEKKEIVGRLYDLAYTHTMFMYKLLFGGLYPFALKDYIDLFEHICEFFEPECIDDVLQSLIDKDSNKNFFRVWREIDIFVENVMAVDIAMTEFNNSIKNFDKRKVVVHGIRYGSIELPIICQIIGDLSGINIVPSFVGIPGKYNEKHSSLESYIEKYGSKGIDHFFNDEDYINILTDDNLMTGRTVQILINDLAKNKCYPDGIIIVRYPSVNRIPHMVLDNHGCPNVDLFFNLIKGLVSSTPYSRLFLPQADSKKRYLDETNVFNKCRQRITRYLFKNGIFSIDSEVYLQNI